MFAGRFLAVAAALLSSLSLTTASLGPQFHSNAKWKHTKRQYFPHQATDLYQVTTAENVTIRYKMPGKEGICETTPGVNSYSGYIDLAPNVHVFFWFFESRRDPANDDFTLWLNGGPGSDSLIGMFEEHGPCRVTEELETIINPWSWNNVSNMLYLSQPVGTGFSYNTYGNGSLGNYTASFYNSSQASPVTGTYPILEPVNEGEIDTTDLAAMSAWHVMQGFLQGLPYLTQNRAYEPKTFNLWTESYGGHYGPSFFNYFYNQNEKIQNGSIKGYPLNFKTLGIINGIISEEIQAPYYPEFALHNTYNITLYNETVYNYAKFALNMINGCLDQIQFCIAAASEINGGYTGGRITNIATQQPAIAAVCTEAADMCRDNVEGVYYAYGDRGVYDIRHPYDDVTPPSQYWEDMLNLASVQEAIGVSVNYTGGNPIYYAFQETGDFIYPNFLSDLESILDSGVRVALIYGDADYICNWFGGQAVSLALNYTHAPQFAAAGYVPMLFDGVEYGETREFGNFSFTRVYESGHEVPFYQPQAAFALFNRSLSGVDLSTGDTAVTGTYETNGTANATHTEAFVSLPPTDTAGFAAWSSSVVASYASLDLMTPMGTLTTAAATASASAS